MLYTFFGTDSVRVRQGAFDMLHSLATGDAMVTTVSASEYVDGIFTDLVGGTSLFAQTHIIVLDTLSEKADAYAAFMDILDALKSSQNHFIVIEQGVTATDKKRIEKRSTVCMEISGEKKERFNAFLLTDALLRRDKKSLWLLLMEAWHEGLSPEEVIGVLFWQLKTLRLVARARTIEETGLKPFVYQKAKRALTAFKPDELDALSRSLVQLYHEGHTGEVDLGLALEQWCLKV